MSEIDKKYSSLKGEQGFLGSPTTEESMCPDGTGRYRHYQNGSIYWNPLTGAHEIHGLIRAKWSKLGWEKSFLGYPKTDESPCPVKGGKYNLIILEQIFWLALSTTHSPPRWLVPSARRIQRCNRNSGTFNG